ncbi:MAG: hypothetical protein MJ178_08960, partial [Treponemataceae bacterium]|nr:hypothetical protein [Treponemataceae bacterium]
LFILPVTRDLFAEVTGNDYATGSGSESYKMQVFLNLCNLKTPDAPEFSFYNRDELKSRYNYRNNDALFFVGIQAKDLDPATFSWLEQ